jgi:hypothetical protein
MSCNDLTTGDFIIETMSSENPSQSAYTELIVRGIDFTHARLVDLTKLADQAGPFYYWIETEFQTYFHSAKTLQDLILGASLEELIGAIRRCFEANNVAQLPKLFDGGGVPYKHLDACFFMFAWIARDAAVQRLKPLISSIQDKGSRGSKEAEIEVLANLIFHYKTNLRFFDWSVIREVTLQRLEGSRRAKKGSAVEMYARTALSHAFTYYYQTRRNYGGFVDFEISDKPLKVKNRTYDVAVWLTRADGSKLLLVLPVKTRETQGGGHSHLFSRDIEQANQDILAHHPDAVIAFVIIAQNWASEELHQLEKVYEHVFYFDKNPNTFIGFDDASQIEMNKLVERILD